MLFKSGLITQGSGSIGGMTIAHNAGGQYIRARTIPTNPNTPRQQAVRNSMAILSTRWVEVLTQVQRDAWAVYAANVTKTNPLGDQINVSGLNMYVRGNVPRIQGGLPLADNAPTIFDIGTFTDPAFTIDTASDELDLTFTPTDDWANEDDSAMEVFASQVQNGTINYFKGPYVFIGQVLGDGTTPPTSPAAIALPGPTVAGQRTFFRVNVTRVDGRLSGDFLGSADAA